MLEPHSLRSLHSHGASLSVSYDLDGSLLNIAVKKRRLEISYFLIDQGVDMYISNIRGLFVFQIAMEYEKEDDGVMAGLLYSRNGEDSRKARAYVSFELLPQPAACTPASIYKPPLPPRPALPPLPQVQYQEQVTVEHFEFQAQASSGAAPPPPYESHSPFAVWRSTLCSPTSPPVRLVIRPGNEIAAASERVGRTFVQEAGEHLQLWDYPTTSSEVLNRNLWNSKLTWWMNS